ncbi:hypothetical protein [Planococcus sp. CAU13]|uniref:hypothetical protein n=1 Tax=Planococcus sp. CAU13 TaxID=1541197 RepID=UPI0005300B3F|nr:hypothetical protein [Planococcus sp. CAU13]
MNEIRRRVIKFEIFSIIMALLLSIAYYQFETFSFPLLFILLINIFFASILIWFIPIYTFQLQLILLAVSTGVYGFMNYTSPGLHISFLDALYYSIRLFFFNTDTVVVQNAGWFSSYPLSIEIARWSAALYTLYALFTIAKKLFGQSFRLFWYQLFGNHYVIYGFHKDTKILIENLISERKSIVVVTEEISENDKHYLEGLGVIVLPHNGNNGKSFRKSRLKRAAYYLIFHENDTKNLDELISLKENFFKEQSMSKFPNLKIYLHLTHQGSFDIFDKYVAKIKAENRENDTVPTFLKDYIPVRIINSYRLVAEKFWDDNPLYQGYEERARDVNGPPFHLAIIGFDDIGKSIFIEALERAHFLNRNKLQATILDQEASKKERHFNKRYNKTSHIAELKFQDFELESDVLYETSFTQATHIIISLPDDSTNITLGMDLAKKFPETPIYIKISNEALISNWLHIDNNEFKNIICFGDKNHILSSQYFVNEQMDQAAKMVHGNYIKEKGKGVPSKWDMLDDFSKESNRKQVSHALTKIVLAGYKPVKKLKPDDVEITPEVFGQQINSVLHDLAVVEHQRWNAFHYIRGWDRYNNIHKNHWKDKKNKLHGCIAPFEDLPLISNIVLEKDHTSFEEYDYQTIKNLYQTIVERLGYKIVKG